MTKWTGLKSFIQPTENYLNRKWIDTASDPSLTILQ